MMRSWTRHGFASSPSSRCSLSVWGRSTTSKPRENFSSISSRHWVRSDAGHKTSTRRMRRRSISSRSTMPACTVFPRPTASASMSATRGISRARSTGTSWYASGWIAPKSGAASGGRSSSRPENGSEGVSADQRAARTIASSSRGSIGAVASTRGSAAGSSTSGSGSTSQRTWSVSAPMPSVYSTSTRWKRPRSSASNTWTPVMSARRLRMTAIIPSRGWAFTCGPRRRRQPSRRPLRPTRRPRKA